MHTYADNKQMWARWSNTPAAKLSWEIDQSGDDQPIEFEKWLLSGMGDEFFSDWLDGS